MKQLKEFKQGELIFIWDSCSKLLQNKLITEYSDLRLLMIDSPDVRIRKDQAEEALRELELMYGVVNRIGDLITLSSLKEEIKREKETGKMTLLRIRSAIRRYYDSARK